MKKLLFPILSVLLISPVLAQKISSLPAASGVTADDLTEITNDPAGTPASQKATAAQWKAFIRGDFSAFMDSFVDDSDASAARTTLGLVIGTNVQASDSDLSAIAALTPSNNDALQYKAGAWTNRTMAQLRTDLGLVIGTNVQAWDADLDTWATKTAPAGTVVGTSDTQTLTNKSIGGGQITSAVATATALAANGANCSAGNYPLGVDASGAVESCTAVSGGTPAGSTTQVQYNNAGAFGADAGMTYDASTDSLTLGTNGVTNGTLQGSAGVGGASGTLLIKTQNGPAGFASGGITMTTGTGGSSSLNSSPITISTGNGGSTNGASGDLFLSTGSSPGSGTTGDVNIEAGNSTSGTDGQITLTTGGTTRLTVLASGTTTLPGQITAGRFVVGTVNPTLSGIGITANATNNLGFFTNSVLRGNFDANGTLVTNGGRKKFTRIVTTAGAITAAVTDHFIGVNKTSGAATTVDLPTCAAGSQGQELIVKDIKADAATNNITIDPNASELIDGASTYVINTNRGSMTAICDATNGWQITASR